MFKVLLRSPGSAGKIEISEDEQGWSDIELASIETIAICDNETKQIVAVVEKPQIPTFKEFVQFKTALIQGLKSTNTEPETIAQGVGWTDGQYEYVLLYDYASKRLFMQTTPRMHYHLQSPDFPGKKNQPS